MNTTLGFSWSEQIMQKMTDEIYIVDQYGIIKYINRTDITLFGANASSLKNTSFFSLPFIFPHSKTTVAAVQALLLTSNELHKEYPLLITMPDGTGVTAVMTLSFLQCENLINYYQIQVNGAASALDRQETGKHSTFPLRSTADVIIHELTEVEIELRTKERLLTLIESIADAVFVKGSDGRWLLTNSVAKDIFKLWNIEWEQKTDAELADINLPLREAHLFCINSDAETWKNKVATKGIEIITDDNGIEHCYDVIKVPTFDETGKPKELFIVGREITEQVKMNREISVNNYMQEEMNKILKTSLQNRPLKELLDEILHLIVSSPFINFRQQGGIFITDDDGDTLTLVSTYNLPEGILTSCKQVRFGHCLCGKAAACGKNMYSSCVDDKHEIIYPGIQPHGHYNIPILYHGETLGVIVVYLEPGHIYNAKEVQFLESIAEVIAGVINRKRTESKISANIDFLEKLDKVNKVLASSSYEGLDELNNHSLQTIMELFGADRIFLLYPCDPETTTWSVPMEYTNPEYPGAFQIGEDFLITEEYKLFFSTTLETDGAVVFDKATIPPEQFEAASIFSIKAALSIAIRPRQGKPWMLGLHQCSYNRIWTKDEQDLFRQIAKRLSFSVSSFLLLKELHDSETKYRLLTETARDIIVSYNVNGTINYINTEGQRFLGLEKDTTANRSIFDFIPKNEHFRILRRIDQFNSGIKTSPVIELNLIDAAGDYIPFEINTAIVEQNGVIEEVISVIRNITERKKTENLLISKNQELRTINEELDRFVYSASHELRSPLTLMMGLTNIIKELAIENPETSSYLKMMDTSISRLDLVIRSIIDYSKNNRLLVNHEALNMSEIYHAAIESAEYIENAAKVRKEAIIVQNTNFASDKIRIKIIVENLISNAIKFQNTGAAPFMKFSFRCDAHEGIITVEDNGEGIPAGKFTKVFEMFYRNSISSDGAGLGLYIVKQVVAKLNGSITLESAPGRGSKFIVRIPNTPTEPQFRHLN